MASRDFLPLAEEDPSHSSVCMYVYILFCSDYGQAFLSNIAHVL